MNISLNELLTAIKESVMEREVCVPRTDFYCRGNDWTTETINFVNGDELVHQLETIAEGSRGEGPTELEMHRAAYKDVKDAGFDSPEQLLVAYKELAKSELSARRKVDELIAEITRVKASKRKPWTVAQMERVWRNSPATHFDVDGNKSAFFRVVRHIEACQGLEPV